MAKTSEKSYSVGEVADLISTSTRTIRYYEEIGLLEHPKRQGNRRIYTDEDIRRLKFIKRLKILGLSLGEMKELGDIYELHKSNDKVLQRLLEVFEVHLNKVQENIAGLKTLQSEIEAYQDRIKKKLATNSNNKE